ncbi:PAQR8 [Branchiostoma lanceolatum]|uniref:PAQR8 protein n=1 Tax=Branchiostoma lanceolatum TaxID=7740 RepID=A0A8J9ZP40_BRALA|nr:PAQR8 [Branchiostoma lanceolatum]
MVDGFGACRAKHMVSLGTGVLVRHVVAAVRRRYAIESTPLSVSDQHAFTKGLTTMERFLTVDEVPDAHKEPFVLTGYRPPHRPWRYYLMSIFSLHNETLNVWTHLITCIYVLYMLNTYCGEVDYTDGVSGKLFLFYGISNFTLHFLSSCAHLLCSRSVAASHIAFSFDYMGIAFYLFNGSLSQCYTSSEPSFAYVVHPWYPWMAILLSCLYMVASAHSHVRYRMGDPKRALIQVCSFGTTYLLGTLPLIHRILSDVYNESVDDVTWMHVRHILLLVVSGFFYASEAPQRYFPGMCDVIGHGHQIFHVVGSASLLTQMQAIFADLQNRRHLDLVRPTDLSITTYYIVLLVSYGLIAFVFVRKALSIK